MARWVYYRTSDGRRVVADEVLALDLDRRGLAKWDQLLTAIRTGVAQASNDFKPLQGPQNKGLWEAILKYDGNAYRLIYSIESGDETVLLAVRAFQKKTRKTPSGHLKVARTRRKDWRDRHRA
jgi:phage-related protein